MAFSFALAVFSLPPQKTDAPAPTFPAQAELVVVDAVVLDAKGNPVEGLRRDDFTVKEDGQAQTVTSFEAVGLPESPPSPEGVSKVVVTNVPPAPDAPPTRSFVNLFDDAQLSRTTGARARAAVKRFLETGLRDADEVTLVSSASGVFWSTRLAEGREDLLALLDRLQGRRAVNHSSDRISDYEATRIVARDGQVTELVTRRYMDAGVMMEIKPPRGENPQLNISPGIALVQANAARVYADVQGRTEASLRALERVANALTGAKGRKSVILVSDGFVYDSDLDFRAVTRAARRSNSAIYFLDARGLTGLADFESAEFGDALQERDVLATMGQDVLESEGAQSLAADSGGFTIRGTNDLDRGLRTIARESRAYYLIGYASSNGKRDGKYRKIQVEVRRAGLEVRARKGYFAASDDKPVPQKPGALDPHVRQAIDSPVAVSGIPLRMVVYVLGPTGGRKVSVLLVADADPRGFGFRPAGDRFETTLDSYVLMTARDTGENKPLEKEISLSLPAPVRARLEATWLPMVRDFELAPGRYQARLLLKDRESGHMGSLRSEFDVPDPRELGVSTPLLTDSLQPGPAGSPPRPIPLARRAFPSDENLLYLFEVRGAAADPSGQPHVTSQYEVRRKDGSTMVRTEPTAVPPGPQGRPARQIAISLKGVPAGDYEIVLTLKDQVSGQTLEREDPFTVEGK
ncbi:MAG TPA: VWA domain-containing protein [Vicinamibacteria bacterium]|nr:VWA domain-containing protein [Vicinamibacteria bacterium]